MAAAALVEPSGAVAGHRAALARAKARLDRLGYYPQPVRIEREVARQIWSRRTEEEMFDCLAWLYDGFALPGPQEKAA